MNAFETVNIDDIPGKGDQLMLIGGKKIAAASGATLEVYNPSTGERIGTVPDAGAADVDSAVDAATQVFSNQAWRSLSAVERSKILWRAADLIDAHAQELASLESLNSGIPLPAARQLVPIATDTVRYFAGWATKIYGITSEISSLDAEFHSYTIREPVGVCAMIVSWNAPIALTLNELAPALAAGCSCIIKPSERTPFTALRLVELFQQAGVPDGVINVVTGRDESTGNAIAVHNGIAKIAFTGSPELGNLLVKAAGGNLKKITLKLRGNSSIVIFEDADLKKAIPAVTSEVFLNSGRICSACSRLYVQRNVYDKVVAGIAAVAKDIKVGSALDPETQIGPLISEEHFYLLTGQIESGIVEGAELLTGGKHGHDKGHFMEPTILANPRDGARILREEVFGPVLTVVVFDKVDEIAGLVNDTFSGHAAAIWTTDVSKAHLTARKLRAGLVSINCHYVLDASLTAGGYKQSGWGSKLGPEGLDLYLQTKTVIASLTYSDLS